MEDIGTHISIDTKQFGSLFIKYTKKTDDVSLEKITQQGDFWNLEWELVQHHPELFWSYVDKKDIPIIKNKLKGVKNSNDKLVVKWTMLHQKKTISYQGFVEYLYTDSNGDILINVTSFRMGFTHSTNYSDTGPILNLVYDEVENIGGEMFIVSDLATKEILSINQQAQDLFNKSEHEIRAQNINAFYQAAGLVIDEQPNLICGEDTILAFFTPPSKGVKWIEIKSVYLDSKVGLKLKVDVICDVTEKIIVNLRNDFFRNIINLHDQQSDFNEFVRQLMNALVQFSDIDIAELWMVNYNEEFLKLRCATSNNECYKSFQTIDSFRMGEGLPSIVFKKKAITYFDNIVTDERFSRSSEATQLGLQSAVGLPLVAGDRILGVLLTFSKKSLDSIRFSWLFNQEIGSAIGWSIYYKRREYDFKSFFNFAPQIHAIIGSDRYIKKINPAFFQITGFDINLLNPSKYSDFIHPEDLNKAETYFNKLFSGEQLNQSIDIRVVDKYSNYKIINWRAVLDTSQDEVAFLFGEDKTELREQQNLIKKSTEMALMGNWVYDKDKGVITISKTLADLLEYSGDYSFPLKKWFTFLEDNSSSEKLKNLVEYAYSHQASWDTFLRIKTAKGTIKWVRSMGWLNTSNHKQTLQGSIQDIHDLKATQLRLEKKTKYLYALSKINEALLETESWSAILNTCLEVIGSTLSVDRVYYFNYSYDDLYDGYVFTHLYEWVNDGIRPQVNDLELKNVPEEDIEPATTFMKSDNLFIGHTEKIDNEPFKSLLISGDIKSIILAPVFLNKDLKGLIGLDSCVSERLLNNEELEFFTTAVQNISIAFDKFHITDELQNALEEKEYILESIQDGFFAMDEDYKVIYWNNKAELIFKKTKIEILEEYIFEVFEDEEFKELSSYFETANSIESALTFELYFNRLKCWLEFNVYANSKGLSVYFRDITEKILSFEKLNASNERFKQISDASNDAIWEWNLENDALTWGDGFQRNFGIDLGNEAPTLESWTERIHKEDLPTVLKTLKNAIKTTNENKFYVRYRFLRNDGEYAYVIDRSSIIRNSKGKALKMVGAITDFSRIIEYEDSLKKLNISLNKRAEELVSINKELEQFAYVASHDLQEPLRMVSSFLKRLDEKYTKVLDDKGKKYISFAVDGAERMRKIITDLLTYSRLINYEGLDEEIDVNLILKEVLAENNKLISEKKAQIKLDDFPIVRSYRTPLKQVFGNLVNNAIKYTDKNDCEIEITCKDNMTHWLFEVTDNGIGIEKEYFDKIFVIFQRLHEHSTFEGSGLGLAIVKKVIEKLGGEIWVESEVGKGSIFSFTIKKQ